MKATLTIFLLSALISRAQFEGANVIWAKAVSGSQEFAAERGIATATDTNGNIFVAGLYGGTLNFGTVTLPAAQESHFLAKYTDDGQFLWAQMILTADLVGIAVDAAGNCYVAGEFSPSAWVGPTNLNAATASTFVAAFNGDGVFLWARSVNVSECYRIVANDNGQVTIAGLLQGTAQFGSISLSNSTYSMYVSRLNSQGTFQWAVRGGTYGLLDDLATDAAGNVFLAGGFWNTITFSNTTLTSVGGSDMFVAKYNNSGNFVWAKRFGSTFDRGAGSPTDRITALAPDRTGNICFAGVYGGNWTFVTNMGGFYPTMLVGKLDSLGNPVWGRPAYTFGFASGNDMIPADLDLDPRGNIYFTGQFSSDVQFDHNFSITGNSQNLFLAKYANNGQFLGARPATSFSPVAPYDLTVDIFGGVTVTGAFSETADFGQDTIRALGESTFFFKTAFISGSSPPVITTNPKDRRLVLGGSGTLSVVAESGAALSYQWTFNGTNLPSATSASYNVSNMDSNKIGPYRVRVSNTAGAITSAVANVGVAFAPAIITHPVSQVLTPGSNITFSVSASGTAPLSYRWLRDGAPIAGATGPLLTLTDLQPSQAGSYVVVVTNEWGSASSTPARLDMVPHLQFRAPSYVVAENSASITIPVMRAYRTSGPVSVSFTTSSGNAYAGLDYTEVSGTLSWANGESADKTIQIPILNDTDVEDNEALVVTLFAPTGDGVVGAPAAATVVILDNESTAKISMEQAAITVNEAAGAAEIRVVRSGGVGQTHSVHFNSINGTAVVGSDFAATDGLLSFAATEAIKSILVPIVDDFPIEGLENFTVRLSGATAGATITQSNTLVTIEDTEPSVADRFGHGLLIADFQLLSYEVFSSVITARITVTNPAPVASMAGQLQLDGTAPFAGDQTNYVFSAIPARSAIQVDIAATGRYIFGGTSYVHAIVFEQAVTGLVLQDKREIFQFFGTAPPSGGVPVGCCLTTGQPVPNLPYVTNVIILGADAINEGTSAQYSARVVLSNGVTNNSPAVTWGASAFTISGSGLLTLPHVSSNSTVYVHVTNTFNGLTKVATKAVTVRDLRARLLDPRLLTGNRHRLTISGPGSRAYDIQESTNLASWANLARVTNLTGTLLYTNTPPVPTRRFYRLRER